MDIKRKEEIEDVIFDVADGKLDEGNAVEKIMIIMEEYADEMLVLHVERQNQDAD